MVCSFDEDFANLRCKFHGTILTGKCFAPFLKDLINRLHTLAVENCYRGSDVLAMREQIRGDFVIIQAPPSKATKR